MTPSTPAARPTAGHTAGPAPALAGGTDRPGPAGGVGDHDAGGDTGATARRTAIGRWYLGLKVGQRIALGFGFSLAMVLTLAITGYVFLVSVTWRVDGFSHRDDIGQYAAELDIGMRALELSVRDQLAEGDVDSYEEAERGQERLRERLAQLSRLMGEDGDAEGLAETNAIREALDAYWNGFSRVVAVKDERGELLNTRLPALVAATRAALEALKDVGGVDSATLVARTAVAVTEVQERALRFAERRDMMEGERMREAVAAIRDELVALNRYLWVAGTRTNLAVVGDRLNEMDAVFDALDNTLVEEDALRADVLVPNAAAVTGRARDLRLRTDAETQRLRGALSADAATFGTVALWVGGVVLVLGAVASWFVVRGVTRPVTAVTRRLRVLAKGGADDAPADEAPVTPHDDEIADLDRAARDLGATTVRMSRALTEGEEERRVLDDRFHHARSRDLAKTDFLINLGQELHGPLNGLAERAQDLMTELHRQGAVELANDAETMQWATERLVGLMDAVLDYARIEGGDIDLCLQDFDVARLVVEARERSVSQADLNGNTLTAEPGDDLGGMHSDFAKVRQILLNLLDNACRYTQGGEVALRAWREAREGRDWVSFTVADNGPGFLPDRAADLFRPFVKGGGEGRRRQQGAGLGLTLVAHYTAMLGGELELASAVDKGARFTVHLPASHRSGDGEHPLRIRAGELGGQLGAPIPLLEAATRGG